MLMLRARCNATGGALIASGCLALLFSCTLYIYFLEISFKDVFFFFALSPKRGMLF